MTGLTYHQQKDGTVRVDAKGPCGHLFEGIATIHEPDDNPFLELPRPLGTKVVQMILTHVHATCCMIDMEKHRPGDAGPVLILLS